MTSTCALICCTCFYGIHGNKGHKLEAQALRMRPDAFYIIPGKYHIRPERRRGHTDGCRWGCRQSRRQRHLAIHRFPNPVSAASASSAVGGAASAVRGEAMPGKSLRGQGRKTLCRNLRPRPAAPAAVRSTTRVGHGAGVAGSARSVRKTLRLTGGQDFRHQVVVTRE